ncbi:hypothetical protein M8J76_001414 [Diaphorina citri]|nr:hypothetical protein M8J76_001414 [Diaphorina citri]
MLCVLSTYYPSLCPPQAVLLFSALLAFSLPPPTFPADTNFACGGVRTNATGIIQTPHFPAKFQVPIRCSWTIENADPGSVIVLYFTQLYVTAGFTVTDYSSLFAPWMDPTVIFVSNEHSVLETQWISTQKPFVVVDFALDSVYGTHIRALDNLLDVYGFNVTYEIAKVRDEPSVPDGATTSSSETASSGGEGNVLTGGEEAETPSSVRAQICSVVACSFSGHCYANENYTAYECACFDGFSGPDCGNGPLCRSGQNVCENGARCRHAGSTHVLCECPDGYSGARCEILPPAPHSTQNNMDCSPEFDPSCSDTGTPSRPLCPYSGDSESPCICDENEAVPVLYGVTSTTKRLNEEKGKEERGDKKRK